MLGLSHWRFEADRSQKQKGEVTQNKPDALLTRAAATSTEMSNKKKQQQSLIHKFSTFNNNFFLKKKKEKQNENFHNFLIPNK